MTIKQSLVKLESLNACQEAQDWVKQSHAKSHQELWWKCNRGDWMLWLLGKLSGGPASAKRKKLVKATCGCARLALKFVKKGENRPRVCIETAEAWANGKATIEQVKHARSAVDAAYAAAADAAYAAAYAADAADAAAYAADAAAYAADAYAAAAAADAYAAAADAADAAYAYAAAAAADAYAAAAAAAAADAADAYADAYADAAAARKQMLKDCADVVRKFFPKVPRL